MYLNGHKLPRDKASLEVIFVQPQKTVEPAPVEEAKHQFPVSFSSYQQPMLQPQFNYFQPPAQFFPPQMEPTMPSSMTMNSSLTMAAPFTPSMQLPKSPKRQKAYYEVYDPYQTEEDQGVKYTCRYDIQIENEKEF